ncbi:MAG: peptidase M23 [Acidiferrobacteraceae bacterium]|nr:peptidase M23 [Acidiferrobacteraceae bacterium]
MLKRRYWLIGGAIVILAGVWLVREPIASIGSLENTVTQRGRLTTQLIRVIDEESRLVRESIFLNDPLVGTLSAPIISLTSSRSVSNSPSENSLPAKNHRTSNAALTQFMVQPEQSLVLTLGLDYILALPASDRTSAGEANRTNQTSTTKQWRTINIESGDSLSEIFKELGLEPGLAISLAKRKGGKILNNLRLGPHLQVLTHKGYMISLRYQPDALSILSINRVGSSYRINTIRREFDTRQAHISGQITSSLYQSGIENEIDRELLYKLATIFQWQIDFNRDLRPGDKYSLIYEEQWLDGEKYSSGPILAAEFVVRKKSYRAIMHVGPTGATTYFTPDGESLQGLFLRSPVRITRITSRFTKRRYHPVLKKWRAHKGVDYGGNTGDPVMATADGRVSFAGNKNHYGKVIILQHGEEFSTLYAHLSRFGKAIRAGSTVTQGQIIGYMGATGLATGPHLHYEFRVNGVHKDPLTVKLPRSFAIDRSLRSAFLESAKLWSRRLDQIETN